ncbi:insulin-like growth factor-binding protein 5 [Engraulis encrasicolus]|uniref:insulin-like growth factor-binding protein 5 n=1 Tax=Engraulis encrasicolus TaxID=184585 RepID=UPI002FD2B3AD
MKAMLLFPNLLTLLVILPLAVPASRAPLPRHGFRKICPTCKDASGAGKGGRAAAGGGGAGAGGGGVATAGERPVEESTAALGPGELCGVYTLGCARGLRCNPPPGDPNPLHALLQGKGVCSHLRSPTTGNPQTTVSQPSTTSEDFEKGPCRKEQNRILPDLELKIIQSDHVIYIPNCDRRGFYRKKQCKSSRGIHRGECWCVNELGARMPSRTAEDGTVFCDAV